MNLAKVRSVVALTLAMLALVASLPAAAVADPDTPGREAEDVAGIDVVVAVLPYGTTVEEIGAIPELAPGIVSAGLGSVPVAQTYLDISQGNRVNQTLYEGELPRLYVEDGRVPAPLWERVMSRAEGAPADVVPGLLASTLADAGVPVTAEESSGLATLIAVDRDGAVSVADPAACAAGCGPGFTLMRARLGELADLSASLDLDGDDVLIALAAGARAEQQLLPIGIAGRGFHGDLTSDSTRTDGLVTTTDIAPTVLEAFGADVPDEINGNAIRSSSERDAAGIADLQRKLEQRPSRGPVVLLPLGIWVALSAAAALLWRRRGARTALRLLGLSVAIGPALLLVGAAVDASTLASALLFGAGSVAAAAAIGRLVPGPGALAVACGLSVGAYALDVVAGSPLSSLSVLGPNPGYGVRFFGIGNELEAILTTLTVIGTGAALAARPAISRAQTAACFVGVAVLATLAFAPGRFGADVGAAIVLGVGAATAAVLALGLDRRRSALLVIGGGAAALVALLAIDAVLGGAHLSESVLGAGEASDVADVLERRVTLMADTFTDPVYPELLVITAIVLVTGFVRRETVLSWFGDGGVGAARCGFLGALAGVVVGTFANDSGSVLLVLGTICLAVSAGFFWASAEPARKSPAGG